VTAARRSLRNDGVADDVYDIAPPVARDTRVGRTSTLF
jgi:hypothetical protein